LANSVYIEAIEDRHFGGDMASTWVLKLREHSGAHEDLVKNVHFVIGNDYALAA